MKATLTITERRFNNCTNDSRHDDTEVKAERKHNYKQCTQFIQYFWMGYELSVQME